MVDFIERCFISVYFLICCDFLFFYLLEINLIRLKDCKRGIVLYLIKNGVWFGVKGEVDVFSEVDLICKWVGFFIVEELFIVCFYYRDFLGIYWCFKIFC